MRLIVKKSVKRLEKLATDINYHRNQNAAALKAVRSLESCGGLKLAPNVKAIIDDYARDVFGSRRFAPWLYVYTLMSGSFKEGWIPDNFYGRCVVPHLNKRLRISELKSLSNIILKSEALPDLAYSIDGVLYDRNLQRIDVATVRQLVKATADHAFIKQDNSRRGRGVYKISVEDIDLASLKLAGNCVIQAPIRQHAFFDEFIADSVATLRITTVRDAKGSIDYRASYLRFGRRDMAWIRSENSIKVAVVGRNGEMDVCGYNADWTRCSTHPDTGVPFANHIVPKFQDAIDYCVRLHSSLPHFAIVGWDVSIDHEDKVRLIEWNASHCGIKFSEAVTGPCFRDLNWERFRAA